MVEDVLACVVGGMMLMVGMGWGTRIVKYSSSCDAWSGFGDYRNSLPYLFIFVEANSCNILVTRMAEMTLMR